MVLFRLIVKGFWVSLLFLGVLIVGDSLVPGKLAETVFSPLGIIIIFSTVTLDYIFSFHPVDPKKEEERRKGLPV